MNKQHEQKDSGYLRRIPVTTNYNWKSTRDGNYKLRIKQIAPNICTYNTFANVLSIPDDNTYIDFKCWNINFAEVILKRWLEIRNKELI